MSSLTSQKLWGTNKRLRVKCNKLSSAASSLRALRTQTVFVLMSSVQCVSPSSVSTSITSTLILFSPVPADETPVVNANAAVEVDSEDGSPPTNGTEQRRRCRSDHYEVMTVRKGRYGLCIVEELDMDSY
ncbi:hypothetical protein AOLI_G00329770 [Acnodon oligacanthus]